MHLRVSAQDVDRPNILLLFADDLGWVDPSSDLVSMGNGSRYYQTPNIDRLAAEGKNFTAAYTQQNCQPTRVALLTGQPAPVNGTYNVGSLFRPHKKERKITPILPPKQRNQMPVEFVTVAEVLNAAGYHCVHFGKTHGWAMSEVAAGHGFDVNLGANKKVAVTINGKEKTKNYFAAPNVDGRWLLDTEAYTQHAEPYTRAYVAKHLMPVANGNDPYQVVGTRKHFTDAIGDVVVEQLAEVVNRNEPFFFNVCFHAVHTVIASRPDLDAKYRGMSDKEETRGHRRADYAGLVEQLDQTIGRILGALDDPNGDGDLSDSIANNTLVIFTSDNGGVGDITDNTPLRGAKGEFYEGGIRVPLIAKLPGIIDPGTTSGESIHVIDFYPTFAEIGEAELPRADEHRIYGESFAGILRGETKQLQRDTIYWHFPGYLDDRQRPRTMINQRVDEERYKLFYNYEDGRYELFNLTRDLGESLNLLEGKPAQQHLVIARKLNANMREWLIQTQAETGTWRESGKPVPLPPADPIF